MYDVCQDFWKLFAKVLVLRFGKVKMNVNLDIAAFPSTV